MLVGPYEVLLLREGTFYLDGGSMFGIVPRPLWSRAHPPDERGRIAMALRSMLVLGEGRSVLIDVGIGARFDERQQAIYSYESKAGGIRGALARVGLSPEAITDVVLTHLHFDHAGGLLTPGPEGIKPTFPNARHHVQKEAWVWAGSPSDWDRGSFFSGDLDVLVRGADLVFHHGDDELAPLLRVQTTCGHTPGHQIAIVGEGPGAVAFCADLIPTATHVRLPYIMAYDQQPLSTLEEKETLLAEALEEDWVLVFEHDPVVSASRLAEADGRVTLGEAVCLNTSLRC